jgi:hypothetical protein
MAESASGGTPSSLQIAQDLDFQAREWRFQRIGWVGMLVVVVAALLGAFATGPLSRSVERAGDESLTVSFERFTRFGAPSELVIDVPPDAVGDEARVAISRDYLTAFQVQAVSPEPDVVRTRGDTLVYAFDVDRGSGLEATFNLQADERWLKSAEVRVPGRAPVSFDQLVYP